MGLSKWVPACPASTHVFGLASHLVWGVATDRTIKLVEKAMGKRRDAAAKTLPLINMLDYERDR
jgi:hypothetical protein